MHAYLVAGNNKDLLNKQVEALIVKLDAQRLDFSLQKIADTKELKNFTKLKLTEPTAIVIDNFDKATEEAQNAFLKALEEPQENLYYILTVASEDSILPTITSRCQLIQTGVSKSKTFDEETEKAKDFIKMSSGQKLKTTSQIKDREEAINFVKDLILGGHQLMLKETKNVKFIEQTSKTLKALEANGNVQLQLTNFVVGIES